MAFPDTITPFLQAQDPQNSIDVENILNYQNLLNSGDLSGAQQFLMSLSNGIQMSLNAGRYNQVIQAIREIEQFYLGLNGVKQYINDNISAFGDIALYNQETNYSIGNLASDGSKWYKCIQINGPETSIVQPGITSGWETYWELFLQPQNAKQYPIQIEQPTTQNVGDLWFQIIQ